MGLDSIDWRDDALCSKPFTEQVRAAGVFAAPDDYFHIDETRRIGQIHLDRLRAVCNACPVKAACADYAVNEEPDPWGVLAGMTPEQIRKAKEGRAA